MTEKAPWRVRWNFGVNVNVFSGSMTSYRNVSTDSLALAYKIAYRRMHYVDAKEIMAELARREVPFPKLYKLFTN